MINITIDCATGAEVREHLLAILGLTGQSPVITTIAQPGMIIVDDPKPEATGEAAKEFIAETVKKRRSKAEIEAEKNRENLETAVIKEQSEYEEAANQTGASQEQVVEHNAVTKEDLQKKAVELGRVGKKELCRAVLQKHGADSISTADKNPLKLELYAIVLDEFNKL